jgi:hypothetical protein
MKTQLRRNFRCAAMVGTLLLAGAWLALAQSASNGKSADVPHLIKFSGALKDDAGHSKTGVTGIAFALYKDQQGGAPLWLEIQNVQADGKGSYTVLLGSTKSEGLPIDLFTSGGERWLGVQPQGQNEQPRVLLVSAPYALKAADAETLGGKPASAFLEVTPGNANGSAANAATSGASLAGALPTVHGSGKTNFIPLWKSKTTLGDSALFQSGGKVGIGTTTPSAPLDVKGNATIEGNQNVTGNVGIGSAPGSFQLQVTAANQLGTLIKGPASGVGAGLDLQTTGTGGKGWEILATGKTAAQGPNKLNIRDLSSGTDVFTIAPGGLVGIGSTNPGTVLQVTDTNAPNVSAVIAGDLSSSNPSAAAVFGDALATTGATRGVFGEEFSSSAGAVGVEGEAHASSGQTSGVQGYNFGSGNYSAGVSAVSGPGSGMTFGVIGVSNSPNGTGTLALGEGQSGTGLGLIGCCPVGLWGDTSSSAGGAAGLVGTADDARAIFLQNNSPSGVPTLFAFNASSGTLPVFAAGGSGGFCNIDTTGHLACANALSVLAPVDSGQRQVALYAVESPQNWFEDFGSGQLANGTVRINLDRTFAEAVNTGVQYHVFLTPRDECEGLFVSHATANGFEVHELHHGSSNVAFDYRIVALRRGLETVRLEDMTERLKKAQTPEPTVASGSRLTLPAPARHLTAELNRPLEADSKPYFREHGGGQP